MKAVLVSQINMMASRLNEICGSHHGVRLTGCRSCSIRRMHSQRRCPPSIEPGPARLRVTSPTCNMRAFSVRR